MLEINLLQMLVNQKMTAALSKARRVENSQHLFGTALLAVASLLGSGCATAQQASAGAATVPPKPAEVLTFRSERLAAGGKDADVRRPP